MKKIHFWILLTPLFLLGFSLLGNAQDDGPFISSDPEAATLADGTSGVVIDRGQTVSFTFHFPDLEQDSSWEWNFAEFHLDCSPSADNFRLNCTSLAAGNSIVSVSWQQNEVQESLETNEITVKVEEADSPPEVCTEEYDPVCGLIEVQCITTPCDPVPETFPNRCYAERAGAVAIIDGACEGEERPLPPATYEDEVLISFEEYKNPFPDTDMDTLEGQAAAELYRRSALTGFPDGELKGSRLVNRAEFAKILVAIGNLVIPEGFSVDPAAFSDISVSQKEWFTDDILLLDRLGIVSGYPDGKFRPSAEINTAEFLKMLVITFDLPSNLPHFYPDVPAASWYASYAGVAQKYDLFPERGNLLQPERKLSRREIAVALYQYLKNRSGE